MNQQPIDNEHVEQRQETEFAGETSEFLCAGCSKPLHLTLRSDMCFAEALVYCPDCEREYQQQRAERLRQRAER